MSTEHTSSPESGDRLEMPAPTLWPMVMAAGVTLMGAGVVTNYIFTLVGVIIVGISLAYWLMQLLPGQGEVHEPLVPPEMRVGPVREHPGDVEHMRPGMPGHRMRMPEKIHPYSAGVKGGLVGALVMPLPALLYGLVEEKSLWFPVNLLVGMVVPLEVGPDGQLTQEALKQLHQFHFTWFVAAVFIHIVLSVSLGLMYGVLLPMLGTRPILWGGIVAPLLWTGAAYGFMGVLNPALSRHIDWISFFVAQFIFGIVVGLVVVRTEKVYAEDVGALGFGRRSRQTMVSPPGEGGA